MCPISGILSPYSFATSYSQIPNPSLKVNLKTAAIAFLSSSTCALTTPPIRAKSVLLFVVPSGVSEGTCAGDVVKTEDCVWICNVV